MYGKLFAQMYDGTLMQDWRALVTFQQMIVLCNRDGVLDMTPHALAGRTGIPIEVIKAGIEILEREDPASRTPDSGGRRIERLDAHRDWGWKLVNYHLYRALTSAEEKRVADRERLAAKRALARMSQDVAESSPMSQDVADVAQAEAEAEAEALKDTAPSGAECSPLNGKHPPAVPVEEIIKLYHETLPMRPRMRVRTKARTDRIRARWHQLFEDGQAVDRADALEAFQAFFKHCAESKFLTGRVPPSPGHDKAFIADLDWLMTANNFAKTVEDKYNR